MEDLGIDGGLVLEWIFEKWNGNKTGLIWFRIGTGGGGSECSNEPSGY
jgi:hypothetical protein